MKKQSHHAGIAIGKVHFDELVSIGKILEHLQPADDSVGCFL